MSDERQETLLDHLQTVKSLKQKKKRMEKENESLPRMLKTRKPTEKINSLQL